MVMASPANQSLNSPSPRTASANDYGVAPANSTFPESRTHDCRLVSIESTTPLGHRSK